MSVPDNEMSVGNVQKLNINGLCQWLKGKLNDDILEIAQTTISTNWISGEVFLHYNRDNWIGYGMKGGVADSLVILAEKVKNRGTPKGSKKVSELFPEDFLRVMMKPRNDETDKGNNYFDVIEMRDLPPMVDKNDNHKKVYVRRCYIALFDELVKLIQEGRFNAMITGNPGIGKSYFYLYVIFRFIKNPVLLGGRKLVINSGEDFHILKEDIFESIHPAEIRLDGNILRLVDGATSRGQLTGWDGTTILFASPSNSNDNKPSRLMKSHGSNYLYMPVWDDEELINTNSLLDDKFKKPELLEKVKVAGPIPRYVLSKKHTVLMLRQELKAKATSDATVHLLKFVQCKEGVTEEYYSHRLLKMCPNKFTPTGCADFTLNFLSTEIASWVLDEAKEHVVAEFKRFALENNDPDSAKFRGNIYEHLIHRHFKNPTSRKISGKSLDNRSPFKITLPKNFEIKPAFRELKDINLVLDQPVYAFPASKTQGAYDSFLWNGTTTCHIFQITIARKHSILNHYVKEFLDWFQKQRIQKKSCALCVNFVFVVPSAMIDKWNQPQQLVTTSGSACSREGSMVSIKQYVVAIDL